MENRLKIIRAERNLTQSTLAEMSGLSRYTINCIERGRIVPKGGTMIKLSQALQLPIEEIFLDFSLCKNNK